MRLAGVLLLILTLAPAGAGRAADRAGVFDYYLLALSWNPAWCAQEGEARGAAQCAPGIGTGFILHGLWPQFEDGWPQYCDTPKRDPTRAETEAMADIMGSGGLAWHEWKKHGRCSGLDPAAYFSLARRAWEAIRRPALAPPASEPRRIAPREVADAFLAGNPGLAPDAVTVTCKAGAIREVRVCLTRDLAPRPCTGAAARGCGMEGAMLLAPR